MRIVTIADSDWKRRRRKASNTTTPTPHLSFPTRTPASRSYSFHLQPLLKFNPALRIITAVVYQASVLDFGSRLDGRGGRVGGSCGGAGFFDGLWELGGLVGWGAGVFGFGGEGDAVVRGGSVGG